MAKPEAEANVFELPAAWRGQPRHTATIQTDVCLIVEGCYPYVSGGVSSWLDWLMRQLPHIDFSLIALVSGNHLELQPRYQPPDNLKVFRVVNLTTPSLNRIFTNDGIPSGDHEELSKALTNMILGGGMDDLVQIIRTINAPGHGYSLDQLMHSRLNWKLVSESYESVMPHASFAHFYWAWRSLFGGMFATIKADLPPARAYHTISTGYAGLLAARAAIETGRPAAITEHGIYTNERRIEILMADWIADSVVKGIGTGDNRLDIRDVWTRVFDSYARTCYDACDVITTLYEDNQRLQTSLGADKNKMMVIANGINLAQFEELPVAPQEQRPTVGLIGRVVPIKDIKSFIAAAGIARERIPDLQALIMGPTDEDPTYFEECSSMVTELELQDCVTFTGAIKLTDYLPRLHTVVLTSLSEAQPLVLLEAGAAGIPCVATDVGSCREIIQGRSDERPSLGDGGTVTGLVAPDQIASAVCELLENPELRRQRGEVLRKRVQTYYSSDQASTSYGALYDQLCKQPDDGNLKKAS